MKRAGLLTLLVFVLGSLARGAPAGAEAVPVIFQSAPGRFEIAAVDIDGGQRVTALAGEAWQLLAGPLALPESFSSPVFVRLIPELDWGADPSPFRVIAEAGGVVSVRVRWSAATPEVFVRRALVQGLLIRLGVAQYGVTERLTAPLWLELACVGWWRTRADPAQLDALKESSGRYPPPNLTELLNWQRGEAEPARLVEGAVWWLTCLQSESTKAGECGALVQRLLGGEAPETALAASFPERFATATEREQWWQTGWHQARRVRTLPALEAADSRAGIAQQLRFVFLRDGHDAVVPMREVLAHARELIVDADLKVRVAGLNRLLPVMHPFYRNAALSLVEVLSSREAKPELREKLCVTFERDWGDATELEAASAKALNALEKKSG